MRTWLILLLSGLIAIALIWTLLGPPQIEINKNKSVPEPSKADIRVLFIGNSHTFYNALPTIYQNLARSRQVPLAAYVKPVTVGGFTLSQHWKHEPTRAALKEKWDFVIIQGASSEPITAQNSYISAAQNIVGQVREQGAHPILFLTWAYASWDYAYSQSPRLYGQTPTELQDKLNYTALFLQKILNLTIAPVGPAWRIATQEFDETSLYHEDGNHARIMGSYLAACTIYEAIHGESAAEGQWFPEKMTRDQARLLQEIAHQAFSEWQMQEDMTPIGSIEDHESGFDLN
ncbi:DUF4886 domain-containing protein [candidate division CSSED10-310 bacterium]|uniref:DUF4886 domain-containing protein n=1 Tax=candidate division CSSED10-310 bacterium TaxID=2855610 RepID=A0ABV6YS45_UNCC1